MTRAARPRPRRSRTRLLLRAAGALLARGWMSVGVIAGVVLVQRLALPLSVIWLGEEGAKAALGALFAAAALSFVRARAADRLARSVRLSLLELYLKPFEVGDAASLPHHEAITARLSIALPTLVGWAVEGVAVLLGAASAVPLVAALIASELGARALIPIGVAGAAGALTTMATSTRVEAAWGRAWDRSRGFLEALGAGYEGAIDLRAHGRSRAFAEKLRADVGAWSAAEGRARTLSAFSSWGALVVTLSAALAASALLTPSVGEAASKEGVYKAFMLVLAAVPTLQTAVGAIANLLYARDELDQVERQRELAERAARGGEVDEAIDAKARVELRGIDLSYSSEAEGAAEAEGEGATLAEAKGGARTTALKGASLTLEEGESVAIMGPNGAGKTTLLYVLLGVLRPDSGSVKVGGREVRLDNARWRERVAFLSQRPFERREATIAENMRAFDASAPDRRLIEALNDVGLWGDLRRRAASDEGALSLVYGELSRGQARRVMLARALLREADLLVLDEPEAHLDAETIAEVGATLTRLAREGGRRVVAVVHDRTIASFASRVVTLAAPKRDGDAGS